jgi:nucleoside-diphosphate-sugar epimerase
VLATQRLLEAAVHARNLRRFVYASSSSVYGNVKVLPVLEETLTRPISPYGVTKLAAEHLCTLYYQEFQVPTVSLRYFTVYGPRQRPDMAFHRFCKSIVKNEGITIFGDGRQTRDFTYIDDIVEANIRAATYDAAIGQVMNIAGGSQVTIREVIQFLETISGRSAKVNYETRQPGDVQDTFASTQQARQLINYRPCVSLRDGLVAEFEYIASLYESQLYV